MKQALIKKLKNIKKSRYYYLQIRKWLGFEKYLGMTTYAEQKFYARYAREKYAGLGEVVDLGSWLGSTTLALLKGLSNNNAFVQSKHLVHCYDLFIWESWMDSSVRGTELEGKFKPGDSFVDEFNKRIQKYKSKTKTYAQDLTKTTWTAGDIEFLLVDAMKTPELVTAIYSTFFPALIPGKSYVLQQDFNHFYTSWVHLFHYHYKNFLVFNEDVEASGSTLFYYKEAIPSSYPSRSFDPNTYSDQEIDAIYEEILQTWCSSSNRPSIAAAHFMAYIHKKNKPKAEACLQKYVEMGFGEHIEFTRAQVHYNLLISA
jgi:hypothetical protein